MFHFIVGVTRQQLLRSRITVQKVVMIQKVILKKRIPVKAKKKICMWQNLVVSVIHSSDSTITISWNKVSNAAFYHVETESEQVTPEFHLDKEHILDTTLTN